MNEVEISRAKITDALLSEKITRLTDINYNCGVWMSPCFWDKDGKVLRMTIDEAREYYGFSEEWGR
jgi:hypothetical protein